MKLFNEKIIYPTVLLGRYSVANAIKPRVNFVQQPIEWLVLEMNSQKRRALLLSKYALDWEGFADCPSIGTGYTTSWEMSYLRKWLNDEFYNECFSDEEKDTVVATYIAADKGDSKGTIDNVFLLSDNDVNTYLVSRESRIAYSPLIESIASGEEDDPIIIKHMPTAWWTRTIGKLESDVICIDATGKLCEMDSNLNEIGIRPAVWVHI